MKDLMTFLLWVLCEVQRVLTELLGYCFIILICLAVRGLGVTVPGQFWVVVLAVALMVLNRTLSCWTKMEG